MTNYKLEFTVEEFINLLNSYYTNLYNKPIVVKYSHDEYHKPIKFYYEEQVDLLGHKATKTTTLDNQDMIDVLNILLKDHNFEVIKLKPMLREECNGYYYYGETFSRYHFEGMELELKEIEKKYKKKM